MRTLQSNENGKKLRAMLQSNKLEFIMEVHSGMSAKIAANTGFKAMWLSGLSLSAVNGVRDNCELSISQVGELAKFVTDAAPEIPLLVDADNLYNNFNESRIAANLYELMGVAGVVAEDKTGMKVNSFLRGETQTLADPDEFCGKLRAARSVVSPDFVIIARLESFITGHDVNHAFERACKYVKDGQVDAILVHSKKSSSEDIDAFMKLWNKSIYKDTPIVIVPTKYYSVQTEHFREIGISTVIWANHQMRASVKAMEQVCERIMKDESLINVESEIASVSHIFELQNDAELKEAEKKYLPVAGRKMNAIILAASRGSGDLIELTENCPKCMLKYREESLVGRQIRLLHEVGIHDITVVTGYKTDVVKAAYPDVNVVENKNWETTNEIDSLRLVIDKIKKDTIIMFGDIVFRKYVLENVVSINNNNVTCVVDSMPTESDKIRDMVIASVCDGRLTPDTESVMLNSIGREQYKSQMGEFVGIYNVGNRAEELKSAIDELKVIEDDSNVLLTILGQWGLVNVQYIKGSWLNIDNIVDLIKSL